MSSPEQKRKRAALGDVTNKNARTRSSNPRVTRASLKAAAAAIKEETVVPRAAAAAEASSSTTAAAAAAVATRPAPSLENSAPLVKLVSSNHSSSEHTSHHSSVPPARRNTGNGASLASSSVVGGSTDKLVAVGAPSAAAAAAASASLTNPSTHANHAFNPSSSSVTRSALLVGTSSSLMTTGEPSSAASKISTATAAAPTAVSTATSAPSTAASSLPLSPPTYWDIDEAANGDPQHCPDLAEDIYSVLRADEPKFMPVQDYMTRQPVIDDSMRSILADWLVEVAEEYRLSSETLYLTMNYIDRYLSRRSVIKSRLQLVGVACCLMAAKYEEIYPPSCDDFVHISDNAYQRHEIFDMEVDILQTLDFRLTVPTIKVFLRRCLRAAMPRAFQACVMFRVNMLANYICELTLLEYHCLKYLPSMIAAAAVCLALHSCRLQPWDATLEHYSHYYLRQPRFRACVSDLHQLLSKAPNNPLSAVREKYASKKSLRVSKLPVPEHPPDFCLNSGGAQEGKKE